MSTLASRRRQVVAAAAVAALITSVVIADEDQSNKAATFYGQLNVPLVNVEVVVTDREGDPIRDLTADDFEILEDGRPVEITHFSARSGGAESSGSVDALRPSPEIRDRDIYLVVYFDDLNVDPRVRGSALTKLRAMVSEPLPPGVKAFIVRFNGKLQIECEPSDRNEDLLAALDRIERQTPMDFTREGEALVRSMQLDAGHSVRMGPPPLVEEPSVVGLNEYMRSDYLPLIRNYASQEYTRNRTSLQGLMDFIRILQGIQGHKAVVWLGSIETRVGENLFRTYQALFPGAARAASLNPTMDAMRYDLTDELRDMIRLANSHRVSFYPLGSLGAGVPVTFEYDNRILEREGRPGTMGPIDLRAEAEAMNVMSESTGGKTLQDSRLDLDLAQISEDLSASYSLAYRPPTPDDKKYHRITVKVKRPAVTVRHRQGYRMMGDDGKLAARTISAAMLGVVDNPLGISVGCRTHEARDDGTFLVPVTLEIPIGALVYIPEADQHVARISIASVVRDDQGRLSDVQERQYPVSIANDRLLSTLDERATFVIGMILRKGPHRITVSVRDDNSAIESIGFVDVDVGDETGALPG